MSLRYRLAQMLGTLIVLIAILASPSMASAHEGHSHKPSGTVSEQIVQPTLDPATADQGAGARIQVRADQPNDLPTKGCTGTCCADAPCGGCISLSHAESPTLGVIPRLAAVLPFKTAPLPGRSPEGLRRPPRSFI